MFRDWKRVFPAVMAVAMVLTGAVFAEEVSQKEVRSPVSRERAQQIALQRVSGGNIVESEFNDRWFADDDYEFTVVDDTNRYEIKVDAKTGEIVEVDQKAIFEDNLSASDRERVGAANAAITPQRARTIAMERAPGSTIVGMEREMEDGRVVYDIEMLSRNSKSDMKIDGTTGQVVSYDGERVDVGDGMVRMESSSYNRSLQTVGTDNVR